MYRTANAIPSLSRSILIGALGFCLVSLIVFATVAFAEQWMYANLGLTGAYVAWTALFILLGGAVFGSLVVQRWPLPKFYFLFGIAFFAYAIGWVSAYFISIPEDELLKQARIKHDQVIELLQRAGIEK